MNKTTPTGKEYIFEGKVAISQTDLNGNINYINRKFCEISDYSVDELINSNMNILRHPDMHPSTYQKLWSTLKSGQVYNGMLKNMRKDGHFYWIDIEIVPVVDKEKRITGYMSVSKASPRKNIQDEKLNSTLNN